MKRIYCSLLLFGLFLIPHPSNAATCNYCGHYQNEQSIYKCEKCGKFVIPSSSNRKLSDSIRIRPIPPSYPSTNTKPFKIKMSDIKGKGKAGAAIGLLAGGSFAFFDNPLLGIILIIAGLFFAHSFFKENSKDKSTVKDSSANHITAQENAKSSNGNKTRESAKNTFTEKKQTLRPTRVSSFDSSASNEAKRKSAQSSASYNDSKSSISSGTNSSLTDDGSYWYNEGIFFATGKDGRSIDYIEAVKCFQKAKNLGYEDKDEWLKYLKHYLGNNGKHVV